MSISVGPLGATGSQIEQVFDCPVGVAALDVVYKTAVSGEVDTSSNDTPSTMPAIGIVKDKPTATLATVILYGEVEFPAASFAVFGEYFVGLAGAVTNTPPSAVGTVPQSIGVANTATIFFVNPKLEEYL